MRETYEPQLNARLTLDANDRVRSIHQVGEPWRSEETVARRAALSYVRTVADTLQIPREELEYAHQPVTFLEPAERGTEYRLSEEKTFLDATTAAFSQTHLNVPVWASGLTVTVKADPTRVVGAVNTSLRDLKASLPPAAVIARWRGIFEATEPSAEQWTGDSVQEPKATRTGSFVADVLGGRAFKRSNSKSAVSAREHARRDRVLSGRFFVYRYEPEMRLPREPRPPDISEADAFAGDEGASFVTGAQPTLPLPPVDKRVRPGADYLVAELVLFHPTEDWGDINWRALVELETGSILYLRALAAHVNGLVFKSDPISKSGNGMNGPASASGVLNGFRDDETLLNLNAPINGVQSLTGTRVAIREREMPTVAAPTEPTNTDFEFDARTNNFAAVNAYYHVNRFFELVEDLGFPVSIYFNGTTFPVPVDHRGLADPFGCPSGNCVNAHCVGTGMGIDHLCYALANTTDTANPIGIAVDWRVHLHELGGHGILHDHVGDANLGFSHSAGDSMAVILMDPESQAPDRFVLAPFVPSGRRHDRPVSTWAFDGPNDNGNADYNTEQMLSTTLFRVYRSIGGDSAFVDRKKFAARYMAYLILRTVGTFTPQSNPGSAEEFANGMISADLLNWKSEGLDGGAYVKVIRWSFEKQGAFQAGLTAPGTVTSEGGPPAVDVYIDDGRAGEYQFQPNHWSTTTIWNRLAPDGGASHEPPVLGASNYAYVRIKNRGSQEAQNVVVRGYHSLPGAGLLWPTDFVGFTTPEVVVGTLGPNNTEDKVVGPFEWTPNINGYGHDCVLMIVWATNDPSNVDNFEVVWTLSGGSVPIPVPRQEVVPEWRLVPNDNNIGQRNVVLVPGGGGSSGFADGLHGFGFWAGNPNPREAAMEVSIEVPDVLAERGWRVGLRDVPSNRFRLAPRERRELILDVKPGATFGKGDVEAVAERDVVVTLRADGAVIGGMTYRLDPALERPVNATRPTEGDDRCRAQAERLLECLDLPGQDVSSVRVKDITVEISMKEDCD